MCESQASKDWRESIHKVIAEPTPTPSITVGTQVRLTGVVKYGADADGDLITIESDGLVFVVPVAALEVIRQPFKRGEVVWFTGPLLVDGDDGSRVVVTDEADGNVLIVAPYDEATAYLQPAEDYERRPSRPKEER
jgi:DNA-binding beta-propeller fold protein YncE